MFVSRGCGCVRNWVDNVVAVVAVRVWWVLWWKKVMRGGISQWKLVVGGCSW